MRWLATGHKGTRRTGLRLPGDVKAGGCQVGIQEYLHRPYGKCLSNPILTLFKSWP